MNTEVDPISHALGKMESSLEGINSSISSIRDGMEAGKRANIKANNDILLLIEKHNTAMDKRLRIQEDFRKNTITMRKTAAKITALVATGIAALKGLPHIWGGGA